MPSDGERMGLLRCATIYSMAVVNVIMHPNFLACNFGAAPKV